MKFTIKAHNNCFDLMQYFVREKDFGQYIKHLKSEIKDVERTYPEMKVKFKDIDIDLKMTELECTVSKEELTEEEKKEVLTCINYFIDDLNWECQQLDWLPICEDSCVFVNGRTFIDIYKTNDFKDIDHFYTFEAQAHFASIDL